MRELLINEVNTISGGRFDVSINFDFGRPAPYVEYDSYDVINTYCDRFGCYDVIDSYVIEQVSYYYY